MSLKKNKMDDLSSIFLTTKEEQKFIDETAKDLFNKHYKLSDSTDLFTLPKPEAMFVAYRWEDPYLMRLKKDLNDVKNRLNDFPLSEWKQHTNKRNKAGSVRWYVRKKIDPELLTQAWCKFYEVLSSYELVPREIRTSNHFVSVHLCEAPGAFITSLNHWLCINAPSVEWDWIATTLNPYYEGNSLCRMINDDRLVRFTLDHWCFGTDNTGNLMKLKNLDALVDTAKMKGEIMLVTADGSFDCMDTPAEQEEVVAQLHYCETVTALHLLSAGGRFLLKIFTIFEHRTICLIFLLCCTFENVSIVKPATSKEGNSETYVVCLGFKGPDYVKPYLEILRKFYESCPDSITMFHAYDIPHTFLLKVRNCADFFKVHQCKVILFNIATFKTHNDSDDNDAYLKKLKHAVAVKFVQHCKLKRLKTEAFEVVGKSVLEKCHSHAFEKLQVQDSFNERRYKQLVQQEAPQLSISILENRCNEIGVELIDGAIFKFELLNNFPLELWISTGEPFDKIYSSRFCQGVAINFRNNVFEMMENMQLKLVLPPERYTHELHREFESQKETKLLIFHFTNHNDSQGVITAFYNQLKDLQTGENLVLLGYSLLTQLNVGLLHLLASTFKCIEFKVDQNVGYIINLKDYVQDEQVLHFFGEIMSAAEKAKNCNQIILTVYPVDKLYESPIHNLIVELNHWVIKELYGNSIRKLMNEENFGTSDSTS